MCSISENTHRQYDSVLKKWWIYCGKNLLDPFSYNLQEVISFLIEIFNSGISYSNINSHKSALTMILNFKEEDQHIIKRFLKGLYNINPPRPKYNFTWDPHPVLMKMAEWYPLNKISLKQLTFKMVVLMALISGQRLQTLSKINYKLIKETKDNLHIFIAEKIKTSGKDRLQPVIVLPFFKEKPELCLGSTIIQYLKDTLSLRPKEEERLILTLKKPIHGASSQTISHWIKNVLEECEIDTNMFSAYSSRHASTSAALRGGANIESIRRAAGWTERSKVFSKFYNKTILPDSSDFANSVLKGSGIT